MSEVRRVSFSTISNSVSSFGATAANAAFITSATTSAASLRFGSDFAAEQNKQSGSGGGSGGGVGTERSKGSSQRTVRLNLELFPTDSSTYPEFNYSKLLHLEKKKQKKLKQKSNGFGTSDPFEENDDDVARIAKELEKKYGTAYASGRGRSKKDDHCDIGLGYDESDSFIDNTEAYDEVIPEEVETIEGGFYINCGALEFTKLHTESLTTKTDEIIKMPNRPKKRVLSSSSEDSSSSDEEDDDEDDDDDDEDDDADDTEVDTAKTSSSSGPAEKRPKTTTSATTTTKKQTQQRDTANGGTTGKAKKDNKLASQQPTVPNSSGLSFSSSNSPKPPTSVEELGSDSEKERRSQKTVKTTTVKDMLKAKRDSFLKMQEGSGEAKSLNGELKGVAETTKSSDDESSSDDSDASDDNSDSNQSAPTKSSSAQQQKKPDESSEKLRSCDTKLPELDAEVVANIQEFKENVKSRNMSGKKFQFDDKLTELFLKIDEACLCIEKPQRNMVFAHMEFQLLLPKYYFLRKAKQLRIKEEKLKSKRALAKLRKMIVEAMPGVIGSYEVELRKYADLQSNNLNADNPPKMPKKKFPWNDTMRALLYDVYQVRWTSYPVLGTRKESLEDFITVYMKGKVVQLWPSGWMRYEELQKEIEKRKAAAKKAKEKKREAANLPPTATSTNTTATTTFSKQFEEFTASGGSRSRANSDTDSVASSVGRQSTGMKRKPNETAKQAKCKAQKIVAESDKHLQQASGSNNNNSNNSKKSPPPTIIVDLNSPSKRTDHSIHSIISSSTSPTGSTSGITTTALTSSSSSQQQQQKHSGGTTSNVSTATASHIINLDNYKSTSDILLTSQQLLHSGNNIKDEVLRRESSSESDCVEIVGVFPATPTTNAIAPTFAKNKGRKSIAAGSNQRSRSATPTQYSATNNNNNNNINSFTKGQQKKAASSKSGNNASEIDVNKVVKVLEELQQHKKVMPPNASAKDPLQ